ncbi:MAG: ATP-dependent Clp protease ATP-binding subunit [Pseudomonas sp.]|uniref:AAA family ATPase n=1 Tax=Pseudomonas sp. TaxID=306 RepID=UPI00339A0BF5
MDLCAICHQRPAVTRVELVQNGQRRHMALCELHYRRVLHLHNQPPPVGFEPPARRGGAACGTPWLDQFSRDLSLLARQGQLDPLVGREAELQVMLEVLARRRKPNPLLIGEPGVGKTALVEGLAQRLLRADVPPLLSGKRLVELNLTSLLAGAHFRGEFERRLQRLLLEVSAQRDQLILFIDEVHIIVGAGGSGAGGLDLGNGLKPVLARGELSLIGATTLDDYRRYLEKDLALARRFQPVQVPEPTPKQTLGILRGLRAGLERHHRVAISDPALSAAITLAVRYIGQRFLPDKAIDLLDQAAARVSIACGKGIPPPPTDAGQQIELGLSAASPREAALVVRECPAGYAVQVPPASARVGREDIAGVVSRLTGIPLAELGRPERERLLHLERRLHRRVIGQEAAVRRVCDAIRLARTGLHTGSQPIASLLFVGPSGVGKTELAKALAELLFGSEEALIRLDMSEYQEPHTVSRLIGAPPGYVGHDEAGQLTERVRRQPYCLILLDELDKAHGDVSQLLLPVLDAGRLTDAQGRRVDFSQTLIIATSNLGGTALPGASGPEDLMHQLRQHFRPEFINRLDQVVVFEPLTLRQLQAITRLQLQRLKNRVLKQGVELLVDNQLIRHLAAQAQGPLAGARELKRQIRQALEIPLAQWLLQEDADRPRRLRFSYDARQDLVQCVEMGAGSGPALPSPLPRLPAGIRSPGSRRLLPNDTWPAPDT